ncbi:hypothetical protein BTXL6_11285 [Bacillus thuringiensis]|nr:hypothetical protein BTXL6_28850 [Bacillus thuringiensis]ALL21983.1 hypothetical protein BTXL6_11285 [Bacillus thuringiensis]
MGTTKEICKKIIQIGDCGEAEIDLHLLKVKGCISFIVNFEMEPQYEKSICPTNQHKKGIVINCIKFVVNRGFNRVRKLQNCVLTSFSKERIILLTKEIINIMIGLETNDI